MGPGAGNLGGEVIFQGKPSELDKAQHSVTHQLFQKQVVKPIQKENKKGKPFGLTGATANNLKNIDIDFYSGQITAVTGVSGSGKSSLVKEALYQSWLKKRPVNCESVFGLHQFEEVLLINQEAFTPNRLSTPLTYTGIIEPIKALFSQTESAKLAGLKKADFSYQSKKGKCPTCNGYGKLKTSMDFMSDIWLTCDTCQGMRYNQAVLDCKWKDRSMGNILDLTVIEALELFENGIITDQLNILKRVGIGHLLLGQPGNTLSGGEAQRLKLANSMINNRKGSTLYLFDEPSTGLHYLDILPLMEVFQSLVESGDTVLFIEHNSTLIESANRVVTLGPGSGENGGWKVEAGRPKTQA
jgi:excinuclease ABC subunit A